MNKKIMLALLFIGALLSTSPALSEGCTNCTVITSTGILVDPTTEPPGSFLTITENGIGVNTLTPGDGVSDGGAALEIYQKTHGFGLFVNNEKVGTNSGNSYPIFVRNLSKYDPAFYALTKNDGVISAQTQLAHPNSDIASNWFWRNDPDSIVPVVLVQQANSFNGEHALQVTQSGSGDFINAGSAFSLRPGGATITNDTVYYGYTSPGGAPLCYSYSGGSGAYSGKIFPRPCE